jgi:hypothetical protein
MVKENNEDVDVWAREWWATKDQEWLSNLDIICSDLKTTGEWRLDLMRQAMQVGPCFAQLMWATLSLSSDLRSIDQYFARVRKYGPEEVEQVCRKSFQIEDELIISSNTFLNCRAWLIDYLNI